MKYKRIIYSLVIISCMFFTLIVKADKVEILSMEPDNEEYATMKGLIYNGIGIETGKTMEELEFKHGQPITKSERSIKNPYNQDIPDQVVKYEYAGFTVYFYKHNNPKHPWIGVSEISVFDESIKLKHGIKINMTTDQIVSILGQPNPDAKLEKDGFLYYFYSPLFGTHEQLRLKFENNLLIQFSWLNWP